MEGHRSNVVQIGSLELHFLVDETQGLGNGLCREFSMRAERGLFQPQASRSQSVELLDES
jgi:hypothetical protein